MVKEIVLLILSIPVFVVSGMFGMISLAYNQPALGIPLILVCLGSVATFVWSVVSLIKKLS
jgi:hypothetical protein